MNVSPSSISSATTATATKKKNNAIYWNLEPSKQTVNSRPPDASGVRGHHTGERLDSGGFAWVYKKCLHNILLLDSMGVGAEKILVGLNIH